VSRARKSGCFFKKLRAVRSKEEARFDASIKRVVIRKVGKERILSPLENSWGSFFLKGDKVSDDFRLPT